ncbi:TetR/AcrR family transcriptional regulator [Nocardioides sp.]|uniref:TetR/AcrR family transcriptional regulator n=1 Tax=Nocardioides sp. TaxID=35761 RepID=UPI002C6BBDB6|nr:TetR family transcriptional regulator [Nocardioides sp.]HXH81069.1 TetR family transcriptional regulator [Nocardioides sp.]
MGRPSDARERLVTAASELLHARGYGGVGVAEICAAAEVRKGSFYHFFESKQALTVEVVASAWALQRPHWLEALAEDHQPLERVERLLALQARTQRDEHASTGTMFGCLFGNLALEMSHEEGVAQAVSAVFEDQVSLLAAALRAAAEDGSIAADRATAESARDLLAQVEGTVLFAKVMNDPSVMDRLWPTSALMLGIAA